MPEPLSDALFVKQLRKYSLLDKFKTLPTSNDDCLIEWEKVLDEDPFNILKLLIINKKLYEFNNNYSLRLTFHQIIELLPIVFKKHGYLLYFTNLFGIHQKKELCKIAVTSDNPIDCDGFISSYNLNNKLPDETKIHALQFVKEEFLTYDIYIEVVMKNGMSVQFINFDKLFKLKDEEKQSIRLEAIKENKDAMKIIINMSYFITEQDIMNMCLLMIDNRNLTDAFNISLRNLGKDCKYIVCKKAVRKNWWYLENIYVNTLNLNKKQMYKIYSIAYKKDTGSTQFIPDNIVKILKMKNNKMYSIFYKTQKMFGLYSDNTKKIQ